MAFNFSISWQRKSKANKQTQGNIPTGARFNTLGGSIVYPYDIPKNKQVNSVLVDMYREIPDISIPINAVVESAVNIPILHVNRDGKRIENSPVLRLLEKPNFKQTYNEYFQAWLLDTLLLGNSYTNKIVPVGFKDIGELFVIPAEQVEIVLKNKKTGDFRNNDVSYFLWKTGIENEKIKIPKEEIVHFKELGKCKNAFFIGESKLYPAIMTAKSLRYNYEARVKLYRDGGAVGIISSKDKELPMTPQDIKEMEHYLMSKNGMTGDQSPVAVSKSPIEYKETTLDAKKLMLNENKIQDFQTICAVYGVPSIAVNDNSNSTYNNMIEAERALYKRAAIPNLKKYLDTHTRIFGLEEKGEKLIADETAIDALAKDVQIMSNVYNSAFNAGVVTEQEYRTAIGENPNK